MDIAIGAGTHPRRLWSINVFRLMAAGGATAALVSLLMALAFAGGRWLSPSGMKVESSIGLASSLTLALLSVPVFWIGVSGLRGSLAPPRVRPSGPLMWLLPLVPLLLGLGHWSVTTGRPTQIILPIAHVLVLGISGGITIVMALMAAPVISSWRAWMHFYSGLWITSILAIVAEVVLGVIGAVVILVAASQSPEVRELLQTLSRVLSNPAMLSDMQFVASFAFKPAVMFGVVFILGLAIPFVEELFKPIGVWLLLKWRPSRAQAFVGGVLGGAGFGLVESLFSLPNELAWSTTVTGRIGTVGLHAFTAGLGGLALSLLFQGGQRRRGALLFAGTVLLHGVWNFSLILSVYGALLTDAGVGTPPAATIGGIMIGAGMSALLLLAAVCYAGIPWVAGWLYRREKSSPAGQTSEV